MYLFAMYAKSYVETTLIKARFVRYFSCFALPLIIFGLANICHAEDEKIPEITTTRGKTYRDVRIMKVTASEVSIIHESGAVGIPLAELPEDLRTKFGYDPAKAEEHKAAIEEKKQQATEAAKKASAQQALIKSAKPMHMKVQAIDTDRVGFVTFAYSWDTGRPLPHNQTATEERTVFVVNYPDTQKLSRGDFAKGMFVEDGNIEVSHYGVIKQLRWVAPYPEKKSDK